MENFLCNYGFSGATGLVSQTAARARASGSRVNTVFGRTDATDVRILAASEQMTDMFLNWLQGLASTVGLTSTTCNNLSSPLRRR